MIYFSLSEYLLGSLTFFLFGFAVCLFRRILRVFFADLKRFLRGFAGEFLREIRLESEKKGRIRKKRKATTVLRRILHETGDFVFYLFVFLLYLTLDYVYLDATRRLFPLVFCVLGAVSGSRFVIPALERILRKGIPLFSRICRFLLRALTCLPAKFLGFLTREIVMPTRSVLSFTWQGIVRRSAALRGGKRSREKNKENVIKTGKKHTRRHRHPIDKSAVT